MDRTILGKLFDAEGFKSTGRIPPLDAWPQTYDDGGEISRRYGVTTALSKLLKLYNPIVSAIKGMRQGAIAPFTLIKVSNGTYAFEQPILDSDGDKTGSYILGMSADNGALEMAVVDVTKHYNQLKPLGTPEYSKYPKEALFAALLYQTMEIDADLRDVIVPKITSDTFEIVSRSGTVTDEMLPLYQASAAVYYAVKNDRVKVKINGMVIDKLLETKVQAGAYDAEVLCGPAPVYITGEQGKVQDGPVSMLAAKEEFAAWRLAHEELWDEEDKVFIPEFPDDYIVAPEALKIARRYIATQKVKRPMVNMMWRGITAYGKSTGVEQVACMLGMPVLKKTCSSNMEAQEFLSDWVPYNGDPKPIEIPNIEEIECDPEYIYTQITGEEKPGVTAQECIVAFTKAVAESARAEQKGFKHVESTFVKALRKGYICEIQEISRIKDAGVLVSLNEYDRPGSVIPLADGSYTRRHPEALCIYTDNVGYASCRAIDPSVLRRMSFIIDSYTMSKERVLKRVRYNTGFTDERTLDTMYSVWKNIGDYCMEHEITEGSVSVSELEMWVSAVMVDGATDLKETCQECVVAKASSVPQDQEEIFANCVQNKI